MGLASNQLPKLLMRLVYLGLVIDDPMLLIRRFTNAMLSAVMGYWLWFFDLCLAHIVTTYQVRMLLTCCMKSGTASLAIPLAIEFSNEIRDSWTCEHSNFTQFFIFTRLEHFLISVLKCNTFF